MEHGDLRLDPSVKIETSISIAERARQREIHSYLRAASITPSVAQLNTTEPEPATRSTDPTLTALVQLACHRLNTERAFLSLIDGSTHYIAAEATQKTSLAGGGGVSEEQDLFLGTMKMDKDYGLCPKTMDFFCDKDGTLKCNDSNIIADSTRYIIKDLLADTELRERPYVKDWPFMRCYLEVPITSPSGFVLGGLSVIHNRLRTFDEAGVKTLTEIGITIMSHIEQVRVKNHQTRSSQLIQALDKFIQEEASIQALQREARGSTTHQDRKRQEADKSGHSPSLTKSHYAQHQKSDSAGAERQSQGERMPVLLAEVEDAFTRSAHLIRDSLGLDGIVFLDASKVTGSKRSRTRRNASKTRPVTPPDTSTDFVQEHCSVLASSTADHSVTLAGNFAASPFSQKLLDRLADWFPRGRIFSADQYGILSGPSTPTSQGSQRHLFLDADRDFDKRADVQELFNYLGRPSSAFFLPMWHFQKERWYAAAIGFTFDHAYSFDRSDSTYLSAFSSSIMTEVLRYEALAVSSAKSDFISAISHELRSPLHGILATAELLLDSLQSAEERSMVAMIQSCGTTLLDTMNHLLEFAKINNLNRSKKNSTSTSGAEALTDLGVVVEDVVESVAAGFAFETSPHRQGIPSLHITTSRTPNTPADRSSLPVLVTLDIQRGHDWNMHLNAGAWKRIVMNILGNALKYTPQGYIDVKLDVKDDQIHFTVQDTGIGIGEEYLKHRLFEPFVQENTFSAGTGLGLAIIRQIVRDLDGRLEVQSKVGIGTLVTVAVPLPKLVQDPVSQSSLRSEGLRLLRQKLQGRRLCIVRPPTIHIHGTDEECQRYCRHLDKSVIDTASKWLGIEVSEVSDFKDAAADVYVIDGSLETSPETAVPEHVNGKRIVVLTSSRSRLVGVRGMVKFLRTPFGPRHLAAVITEALNMDPSHVSTSSVGRPASTAGGATREPASFHASSHENTYVNGMGQLPLAKRNVESQANTAQAAKKQNILAVDDNAINLKILTKLLDTLGCSYKTAMNGEEAVQAYKNTVQPFDLIFMDLSMPVMSGFEATQEIRSYEAEQTKPRTKVIALTGLGDEANESKALACGIDEFWTKPVKMARVKAVLTSENA